MATLTVGSSVPQVVYVGSQTVAIVTTVTGAYQTFTIPGLTTDMIVTLNVEPVASTVLPATLIITNYFVSAANTLKVGFYNVAGADTTATAYIFNVVAH